MQKLKCKPVYCEIARKVAYKRTKLLKPPIGWLYRLLYSFLKSSVQVAYKLGK